MTTEGLIERLRAKHHNGQFTLGGATIDATGKGTSWGGEKIMVLVNPDGPAAADEIERLSALQQPDERDEEIARLRAALIETYEETLWNAYHTGHERDGRWTHMFMSDGEWLAQQVGLDPRAGDYDAQYIKAAIPVAAAKHPALGSHNHDD